MKFDLLYRGRPCRVYDSHPAGESEDGRFVLIQFKTGHHTALVNVEELRENRCEACCEPGKKLNADGHCPRCAKIARQATGG